MSIGSFDGVHRGHLTLAKRLVAAGGAGATSVVVTFDPHPRCVVDPAGCPPQLCGVAERVALLRRAGVDDVVILPFTRELSRWDAARFCDELVRAYAPRLVVEGPGFSFGHGRTGTLDFLRRYGRGHGFDVAVVEPARLGGEVISSSRIRRALAAGRAGEATAMLGRMYTLAGEVVRGRRVGRRLGFPTANLRPDSGRCVPGNGIYAAWLEVGGRWLRAAASIGTRPTFGDGGDVSVEAHVLDWDGDLYGARAQLAFARKLRGERRFTSEQALSHAIARDIERVRSVLDGAVAAT